MSKIFQKIDSIFGTSFSIGKTGPSLIQGSTAPLSAQGIAGDIYIQPNGDLSMLYLKRGASWIPLVSSLYWNPTTTTSQTMVVNNGYIASQTSTTSLLLPATAKVGDVIGVSGFNTGLWKITQNTGQAIHFGRMSTTRGATGSLNATLQYDYIELLCVAEDTDFVVKTAVGNLDII
jgi:hypothetical protein